MRSWNLFHLARRLLWLLRAIRDGEVPTKDVRLIIPLYDAEAVRKEFEKGRTPVFIAWRTCSVTRSHFDELRLFVEDNPEFSFHYFTDQLQDSWMREHFYSSPIYKAYQSTAFGACKSDIFRYCLILKTGGIFASINYLPTQPLTKFLPMPLRTYVISPSSLPWVPHYLNERLTTSFKHEAVAQFWICAVKDHPILKIALDLVITRFNESCGVKFDNVDRAIWHLTGPILLTDAVNIYLNSKSARIDCLTFLGKDFDHCVKRSKYSNYRYIFGASYIGYKKSMVYKSN